MLLTPLFPYQAREVPRLAELGGLLLAYDTGLGKTITGLAMAEKVLEHGNGTVVLIICPASLRLQWARAIAEHTDVETTTKKIGKREIRIPTDTWCVVVGGTPAQRKKQLADVIERRPQYVIAGYETVAADIRKFRHLADMVIIDEATVLSSRTSKRAKKLRTVMAAYRLALTATPVEHRPENIFGIMEWVNDDVLGDFEDFDVAYIVRDRWGRPQRYRNLPTLHKILAPVLIRKRIEDPDVAAYMPKTRYETWPVELTRAAQKVYAQVAGDLAAELAQTGVAGEFDIGAYYGGYDESTGAGRAMAVYGAMQMLLNHPQLVVSSALEYTQAEARRAAGGTVPKDLPGSAYAARLVASGALANLTSSPKLDLVVSKVRDILAADPAHKVVIVSRYRGMEPIFRESFGSSIGTVSYHGEMTDQAKAAAADGFNADPDIRVLLMSHAGAYGVDLPGGSHLINYDPPLSAGQRVQINGRIRRASSKHKAVTIVDVPVQQTIEVRQYDRLKIKNQVATAIVDGVGADEWGNVEARVESLTWHAERAALGASG
ncbi:DEAD/DEAH box helicase [Streptosporangium sp. NPDC050855]|uniref:DEAD/DEAH box helicase n=1 Tax=Streptosporangium sp. NPDC050855 TaxID=3366194 RepID=UPI0037B6B5AD